MKFEHAVKGRELAVITKLLAIFGVVEARQMRTLFSHLSAREYGKILTRLNREGLVYHSHGAKYLSTDKYSVDKARIDASVWAFWAFIRMKDNVLDFCASAAPALLSFSSGEKEFDLIPYSPEQLDLINRARDELPASTARLFVVQEGADFSGIDVRIKNDFAIRVAADGEATVYKL